MNEKRNQGGNQRKDADPKLKALDGDGGYDREKDKGKGKGKDREKQVDEAGRTKCRYFLTDLGRKKGRECQFSHDIKDDVRRCYGCGSPHHLAPACPRPRSGSGSPAKVKTVKVEDEDRSSSRKDSETASVSSSDTQMKDLLEEASRMLKSMSAPTASTSQGKETESKDEVMEKLQQPAAELSSPGFQTEGISTSENDDRRRRRID